MPTRPRAQPAPWPTRTSTRFTRCGRRPPCPARMALAHAPGWIETVLPGVVEHQLVPVRVEQPGVAPQPGLIRRLLFEGESSRLEPGDLRVERRRAVDLQADLIARPEHLLVLLDRERRVAARRHDPAVVSLVDDETKAEREIEGARARDVPDPQGDVVEPHQACASKAGASARSSSGNPAPIRSTKLSQ